MQSAEARIRETLGKFGEKWEDSVWKVQGQPVIYHKTVERIAAKAGIVFEPPTVLRAERDEAVIMVSGKLGERWDWDIGEALVGVNYRVSGKQAAYTYAMSMKRGRDRLILKLIGLHGFLYSEDEADEFRPTAPAADNQLGSITISSGVESIGKEPISFDDQIRAKIDKAQDIVEVSGIMLDPSTQKILNELAVDRRDELRAYAKARLIALGWAPKNREASHAVEDREEA